MYNLLFLLLFCAALCDLKHSKIPNGLIFIGLTGILSLLLIQKDYIRILTGILMGFLIFSVLFLFFQMGILGAGDIKLLMIMPMYISINDYLVLVFISLCFTIIFWGFMKVFGFIRLSTRIPLGMSLFAGYGLWYIYSFM